jgi:hypothetical protein
MSTAFMTPLGTPPPGGARFRIPEIIYAIQHIRCLRGGSQAKLLRASDGYWYITKFQDNPQGIRVLANEMLASLIGRRLRLPVPHIEVIEVDDWLIEHTPELRVQCNGDSRPFTSGLHVGSRYVAECHETPVFDYLPEALAGRIENFNAFSGCLVLDKWLAHADGRQAVFTQQRSSQSWSVTFIDQGYCFNAGEWSFPDLPLQGVYYRNWVYEKVTGWHDFEPALSLAEQMDLCDLWEDAQKIPCEWYGSDTSALCQLLETLHQRRPLIRGLIDAFRSSSRNPFPLWA